ncbi:MAG: cache domain-containing sensor histidine kinase [Ruminiclostridium sp.]
MKKMRLSHFFENIKVLNNLTLRSRLILFFLVIIVVSQGITGSVSYILSANLVRDKVSQQIKQTLFYIDNHMQNILSNVNWVSNLIFSNDIIQDELRNYKYENLKPHREPSDINKILLNLAISIDNINYISITGFNGKSYIYGSAVSVPIEYIKTMPWYSKAEELNGRQLWVSTHSDNNMSLEQDRNVFSNIRILKDFLKGEAVGLLVISIKESVLSDVYSNLKDNTGDTFIISKSGSIISNSNKAIIGQDIRHEEYFKKILAGDNSFELEINGDSQLVNWVDSKYPDWIIINFTSIDYISNEITKITKTVLIVSGICLMLAILFDIIFSKTIIKPLRSLEGLMERAEQGDLTVRAEVNRNKDEVSRLSGKFNNMISKIQTLVKEVSFERAGKKDAEFRALQAQINPHFLYNTLESINSIAKINKFENISKMVIALSKILRQSINTEGEFVTAGYELEQIKNYLTIQRIRYQDKFAIIFDIADDILQMKMLKFILQPLVENAIFHGIEMKKGNGTIVITGKKEDNILKFCITDDGIGMIPEKLKEIEDNLNSEINNSRPEKSYGIYNVNSRIRLYFGNSYGIKYESTFNFGTTVYVILPIIGDVI